MNSIDFEKNNTVRRIWEKDYTVWKQEPAEISNRLGWLTVTGLMRPQVLELKLFAREVIEAGFKHVVLLGMGGSSLGAEVLNRTFGSAGGFPGLIVLDSTVPETILSVTYAVNPSETLFLVSSKSGTTTEPLLLYRYFKGLVEHERGSEYGSNFAAITDAGTPLVALAENDGFRKIFLNPPDIGGRYSILSLFGLVPAALLGVDINKLLIRADEIRKDCGVDSPIERNPGCRLAAFMDSNTLEKRDKLTIVTSPAISSFGLWAEQLIAESTGKEGKGIIPVTGEPLLSPESYGNDRCFVYLRLAGDDNVTPDSFITGMENAGQSVMVLDLNDKFDLGAEFFRWEFATALAGSVLGINPFDQPDVQRAKDAAKKALEQSSLLASQGVALRSWKELLNKVTSGKYLSIMAYLNQSPESYAALTSIRRRVMEKYHIPVTVGYGPRYLHSTGQLHKGGPDSGLFLIITSEHKNDIIVPGEVYTFGEVADAQALGDYRVLTAAGRTAAFVRLPSDENSKLTGLADDIS